MVLGFKHYLGEAGLYLDYNKTADERSKSESSISSDTNKYRTSGRITIFLNPILIIQLNINKDF